MLERNIAEKVLTVGCDFRKPKGGIAQLIYNYSRFVFPEFNYVKTGKGKRTIGSYWLAVLSPFKLAFKILLNRKIEIIHIHTASYKAFKKACFYMNLAKALGKKTVLHIHGGGFKDYYESDKEYVSSQLKKADAIIALSQSWKNFFDEIVDSKKVFAVPNVVPTVVKANIARNDGNVNLLYLGFIYQAKGIFDLAEVINLSKERYRGKVKLYVGGSGVEEERLADFIKSNNLGDLIEMCGWVSGEDKNQLLSQCDAYILPSYIEGLPVSIIEAMTYGLPIISTKVGGIPEIVKDGKNGILFNSGDKQALSNSIDLLVNDNKHRKLMGMESLKMSKEYLPDNIVYCLNEMYKSLIE